MSTADRHEVRPVAEDYSRDLIQTSWREIWLAWAGGDAVAMLWRRGGKVEALNARPVWLRRGAGGALLDVAESDMRREGFTTAELDTYAANRIARAFCDKRGYLVTRTWSQTAFTKQPIPMVTLCRVLEPLAPGGGDVTGA